jgi:hypothetical protein
MKIETLLAYRNVFGPLLIVFRVEMAISALARMTYCAVFTAALQS